VKVVIKTKMKEKNRQRLYEDLIKYSKQIGILTNEIPRRITDRKQMQQLVLTKRPYTGNPTVDKRVVGYGECLYSLRTIFVDSNRRVYHDRKFITKGRRIYYKHKATYKHFINTLVHELTHYRFPYMRHGRKFEQRVNEILRGREFESKHVHLFASHVKRYRQNIDVQPISIITTMETKRKEIESGEINFTEQTQVTTEAIKTEQNKECETMDFWLRC
jgi:hypothetical protein